jgi:hypothetical protein
MRVAVALLGAALCSRGEIVDRIAASVGHRVITESEVLEEVRVTAFIEGVPPPDGAEERRKALERLIDQDMMRREIVSTKFPLPAESDLQPLYAQIRDRYPNEGAYRADLIKYGLTDADIRAHLQWQLTTLRFIEYRFQPGVQVSDADLRREYDQFAQTWREQKKTDPPALEQVRDDIEKVVRQRLIDSALDRWLGEVRTQNDIIYRKGYEQ